VIATLFFFPLLNGLTTSPQLLHWTFFDSLETSISWIILTAIISTSFALSLKGKRGSTINLVYFVWLIFGVFFAAGGLVKLNIIRQYIQPYRHLAVWFVLIAGVIIVSSAISMFRLSKASSTTLLATFTYRLWPLTMILVLQLIVAPLRNFQTNQSPSSAESSVRTSAESGLVPHSPGFTKSKTVILLFDELSVDYLYGDRAVELATLPSLARYLSLANLYTKATLVGSATEHAIPNLFATDSNGRSELIKSWNKRELPVSVWGWYLDYCSTFARDTGNCHSVSFFNPRTLTSAFFPFAPIWSNFNLLPAEWPFNLIKNPVATYFHLRTFRAAQAWLQQQLGDTQSEIIYVHFNIPHTPLINKESPIIVALDPFGTSIEGYLSQFKLVDEVLFGIFEKNLPLLNLIVLSDHNLRAGTPVDQHDHVVFGQLRQGATASKRIETPVDASRLLNELSVEGSKFVSSN